MKKKKSKWPIKKRKKEDKVKSKSSW
jgi:hypothetical protein